MILCPRENSLNFNLGPILVSIVTKSVARRFHCAININLINEVKDLFLKCQSHPSFRIILCVGRSIFLLKSELR
jgi:hypothetical protein